MDMNRLVMLYIKAWSEPDRARRQALLDQVWAEDGTYTDPLGHVAGRRQLAEHIGKFFEQFPGAHLEATSGVDTHHQYLRFTWRMVLADGTVYVEGIDFGEVSPEGAFHRIIGFFGPLAPRPSA
jgi:hypothetical protein